MLRLAALSLAICGAANAAEPPVSVTFADPAKFTDLSISRPFTERERLGLTEQLRKHLEVVAPRRLPPNTRLAVTITDVDMAGEYRPVGGMGRSDLRVVRDMYPPRVDLEFKLLSADGTVEREGKRELRDSMFLSSSTPSERDLLGYEKALLERWLDREFASKR